MPSLVDLKGVTRSNAYNVPVEHIHPGDNPRHWPDNDIQELAEDIASNGQYQPVLLYFKDDVLTLVDGDRRVKAVRYINEHRLTTNPVLVRAEIFKGADAYEAAVATAVKRKQFSAIDLAGIIQRLETNGRTRQEIAVRVGLSEPSLSVYTTLLKLPTNLQRQVHEGKLSVAAAYEMVEMTPAEHTEAVEEAKAEARATGKPEAAAKVTRKHVREVKRKKVERGEASSGPTGLSRKEIREIFAGWSQDQAIEEPIRKLAQTLVRCIDGEVGSRAVLNRLRELAEGE